MTIHGQAALTISGQARYDSLGAAEERCSMNVKESVQRQFGPVAERYATSAVHAGGPDLAAMLDAIALHGTERVLDAGCGTGHTALAFAPSIAAVVGVDLTEAMLDQARRLAAGRGIANTTFERGDVEALAFPDASFDLATSRFSAHHYPRPRQAVRELARVLRLGAALLLVDTVAPEDAAQDEFLNRIETLRDPSHVRDHRVAQWHEMLADAGFDVTTRQTWPLRLDFASWVTRMATPAADVRAIERMMDAAPRAVREHFSIEPDHSFSIPVALLQATLTPHPPLS